MSKILKNTTGSAIDISDTGITIAASPGQYTIPAADYSMWADSSDVYLPLASGDLVFNDGSNDYDGTGGFQLSVAIDILKDTQPHQVNTSAEGLLSAFDNGDGKIRLAIDVGAAGVQIPGPTGATGATGATGPQGDPGTNGTNGTDGLSVESLDEGVQLTATTASLDFVGAGVEAVNVGNDVEVRIPGGLDMKAGTVDGASFSTVSGEKIYDVVFTTAYADTNYTISLMSTTQRIWHYSAKTTTGFRIHSQSNSSLSGETSDWQTIKNGES